MRLYTDEKHNDKRLRSSCLTEYSWNNKLMRKVCFSTPKSILIKVNLQETIKY